MTLLVAIGARESGQNGTNHLIVNEQLMRHVLNRMFSVLLAELAVLESSSSGRRRRRGASEFRTPPFLFEPTVGKFVLKLRDEWAGLRQFRCELERDVGLVLGHHVHQLLLNGRLAFEWVVSGRRLRCRVPWIA